MKQKTSKIVFGVVFATGLLSTTGFAAPYSGFLTPKTDVKGIEVVTEEAFKTIKESETEIGTNNQIEQKDVIKPQQPQLVERKKDDAKEIKSE
jgi:hypothetical protein